MVSNDYPCLTSTLKVNSNRVLCVRGGKCFHYRCAALELIQCPKSFHKILLAVNVKALIDR